MTIFLASIVVAGAGGFILGEVISDRPISLLLSLAWGIGCGLVGAIACMRSSNR